MARKPLGAGDARALAWGCVVGAVAFAAFWFVLWLGSL